MSLLSLGATSSPLELTPLTFASLQMEPWLFVVAGMSPTAYLHDRRMIPRLIEREWGMSTLARAGALTQCVRRFERPPKGWSGKERKKTQNYLHISAAKIEQTGGQDVSRMC